MARKKMDAKVVAAICEALVEVCNDPRPHYGICGNFDLHIDQTLIDDAYYQADDWLEKTIQEWPNWSGDFYFPIWNRGEMGTPREQFWEASTSGNLWNNSTEYGRLRWELLAFLLEEASKLEVK